MKDQPSKDLSTKPLSPHRPLSNFYQTASGRQTFVNNLFDEAAPDYDWVSGLMSFWSDRSYRRDALRRAGLNSQMRMLDVATGTGLMIKAALELGITPELVTGVDPSRGMLAQNRWHKQVTLLEGSGERLPCSDSMFDFVCMGYALRHVEDLHKLFWEFHRVLRPGGRVLILEITRPRGSVGFHLMRFYMQRMLPRLAWLRRRNSATAKLMEYYWATIKECVPPPAITSALEGAGFLGVKRVTTGPILSEYVAHRRT